MDSLTSIVVTKSGSTPVVLWSNTYGYDDLNRRTFTKWADGKGDAYDYDATSQVIGVKYSGTNPEAGFGSISGVATTATWNYDIAGNRTAQVINSATTTYTVNDINQYVTVDSGSLIYNTRGDLLTHGDWTLAYDAFGHLITATGTSGDMHKYFYDAGGTRVGKQLHGEDPVFYFTVGFDRLEDVHTSNGDVVSYVYEPGIDRPLAMIDAAGGLTFFHQDVLGNVVALTNNSGALIQQYRYTVWGEPQVFNAINQSRPISEARSPFLFTAREYDVETGLYHYRARAYSPELGRFLQFDPIDFRGQSKNLSSYCNNAALNFTDPTGLCCETEAAAVSAAQTSLQSAASNLIDALAAQAEAQTAVDNAIQLIESAFNGVMMSCGAAAAACSSASISKSPAAALSCALAAAACGTATLHYHHTLQIANRAMDQLQLAIGQVNTARQAYRGAASALSSAIDAYYNCLQRPCDDCPPLPQAL